MGERPNPPLAPERILRIKGGLFDQWAQLPPEHQASTALVLFGRVLDSEHGDWLVSAIQLLWQDRIGDLRNLPPVTGITRTHLVRANLTEEEIAQLDDRDLRQIASRMLDHYTNDVFLEELEFVARITLEEKRRK